MKIVECVPNFSEGRDRATIDAISDSIRSIDGVELLDVDAGIDTNRTVFTFIGQPKQVLEAAFQAIACGVDRIDMQTHQGAHARMGACDVCPFVPVRDVSMKECVALAQQLGQRVADELGIPIFLYEEAATSEARRNLATIRQGEYEGLANKLSDPTWAPDYGPARFSPKSGATAIGAREFLIAYNFNLNTRDRKIAHDIALDIREAGRAKRDAQGKIIRGQDGKPVTVAGKFKHVKAVGWYMEDFNCAQITMNLTNYKKTGLAEIFDEICLQAQQRGVRCTGSELVGLAPKECLLQAGRHYLTRAGKSPGWPEKELIRLAVQSLGLNELYPFDTHEKIIEYRLVENRPVLNMSLQDFADETSTDSPAPGGGSVAANCGALASALASMAAQLTIGRKGYEAVEAQMKTQAETAQHLKDFFLRAIDDDSASFNQVMAAMRLPKKTQEQKSKRKASIQQATKQAVDVPLSVLRRVPEVLTLSRAAVELGNPAALSDAGVSGLCARAAAEGAFYNVAINLAGINDPDYVKKTYQQANEILQSVHQQTDQLATTVQKRLAEDLTL